tara:strand:- start:64 stop:1167 length:1104 start_codon:yes stop_codon:yes gene_type:complete
MNIKILYYSTVYNELIKNFENTIKNSSDLNFNDHTNRFMEFSRGQEFSYKYYLDEIGYDVNVIYYNYNKLQKKWSSENKILNSNSYQVLEEQIKKIRPTIIYFQNIFLLNDNFFLEIKNKFPFVKLIICWVCSPFSKKQHEIIRNSDLVFTCNNGFLNSLLKLNKRTVKIDHAFDERNSFSNTNRTIDVSFNGSIVCNKNFHLNRFENLYYLNKKIKNFNIYSKIYYKMNLFNFLNFNNLIKFYSLKKKIKNPKYGKEYFMQLHKSKICFNSHLDIDNYSGNMRLFEGTGSGCLMITNYTDDLKNFFNDDEIVSYSSKEDALEKIKYFLDNPKEIVNIATRGRNKTLKNHSYRIRANKINEILIKYI